jgi:hypothetical protein
MCHRNKLVRQSISQIYVAESAEQLSIIAFSNCTTLRMGNRESVNWKVMLSLQLGVSELSPSKMRDVRTPKSLELSLHISGAIYIQQFMNVEIFVASTFLNKTTYQQLKS